MINWSTHLQKSKHTDIWLWKNMMIKSTKTQTQKICSIEYGTWKKFKPEIICSIPDIPWSKHSAFQLLCGDCGSISGFPCLPSLWEDTQLVRFSYWQRFILKISQGLRIRRNPSFGFGFGFNFCFCFVFVFVFVLFCFGFGFYFCFGLVLVLVSVWIFFLVLVLVYLGLTNIFSLL